MLLLILQQYIKRTWTPKNNEELKNMLDNIRTTNRNIVEIAREQEILSMKMLIHNDMGRNILSLQRYYANGCNPSEKEILSVRLIRPFPY